jgi:integrase/recombinase XerD
MKQPKTNAKNDRVKREYLVYLKEAKQRSDDTVDEARHAIDRLEAYTGYKDFGTFNKEQAQAFKKALLASKNRRTGKPISLSTAYHVIQAVKDFLVWLAGKDGYRLRIQTNDIAFLNLTTKQEMQATARQSKPYATLEQYKATLCAMPAETEIERRDRALMALLLLTGMRDAAVVSLKIKHITIERGHVFQDPREVKTKFSKTINTYFFPVGEEVRVIIEEWVRYLREDRLFGPDDPLFPKTAVAVGEEGTFAAQGLSKEHWSNAAPVRQIFKTAFARVNLPYVRPHSVRDTLTQLAYQLQLTPEGLKAWSQNMGHERVLTTLGSYGQVSTERQGEIINGLRLNPDSPPNTIASQIAEIHAILKNTIHQ